MADFSLSLSNKKNYAEEQQIMARVYVSRDNRIRVQTGIWVDPKYFADGKIIIPRITLGSIREVK